MSAWPSRVLRENGCGNCLENCGFRCPLCSRVEAQMNFGTQLGLGNASGSNTSTIRNHLGCFSFGYSSPLHALPTTHDRQDGAKRLRYPLTFRVKICCIYIKHRLKNDLLSTGRMAEVNIHPSLSFCEKYTNCVS